MICLICYKTPKLTKTITYLDTLQVCVRDLSCLHVREALPFLQEVQVVVVGGVVCVDMYDSGNLQL